jgi:hypothetical protein
VPVLHVFSPAPCLCSSVSLSATGQSKQKPRKLLCLRKGKAKQGSLYSPSSSRPLNQFRPATMTKPQPGRGQEDVQVLVQRPYSHDRSSPPSSPGPRPATTARPRPTPPPPLRARPYYRRWSPWIVSAATVACVVVFVVTMYVNDCPRRRSATGGCAAGFLGRFAFQPLKENPLLGPSSATYARIVSHHHPLVPSQLATTTTSTLLIHCW